MSPRDVGDEYKRLLAEREIRQNLWRIKSTGAQVEYTAVNVLDCTALPNAIDSIRQRIGSIAGIIHGAGVLADRKIEDLTDEQFQSVYATKVDGLSNLLAATQDDPLKAIVLFSSSTGRFGRTGQVAYAVANEVLNKTAQRLRRERPNCRVVAINWGPWDGGMVTPALAKVFASEGIGLIPCPEGGELLRRELSSLDGPAEIVVLAKSPEPATPTAQLVMERKVSLADHPVLRSHVIGDKAVVPFALHIEWLAHTAMHGNPGLKFVGFDNLRIFQGVQLDDDSPAPLRLFSAKAQRRDDAFVVSVEMRGTRKGREVTHSRADIILGDRLPESPTAELVIVDSPGETADEIYSEVLFHGHDLHAFDRIDGIVEAGAAGWSFASPAPNSWMTQPVRGIWLADPLAIDAAFQLLSVWSYRQHAAVSLPCFVAKYRQFRRSFPAEGVQIAATITHDSPATSRAKIEFTDANGIVIARMTDAEHVIDPSLNDAFSRGRQSVLAAAAGS